MNGNENDGEQVIEAVQASAGPARRMDPLVAALGEAAEPSPEELDLRQQALGERRKSGPPLPVAGEDLAVAGEAMDEPVGPTEVKEP